LAKNATIAEQAGTAVEEDSEVEKERNTPAEKKELTIEEKTEEVKRTFAYAINGLTQFSFLLNRLKELFQSQVNWVSFIIIVIALLSQTVSFYRIVIREESKDWEDNLLYVFNLIAVILAVASMIGYGFIYVLNMQDSWICAAIGWIAIIPSGLGSVLAVGKLLKALIPSKVLERMIPPIFNTINKKRGRHGNE